MAIPYLIILRLLSGCRRWRLLAAVGLLLVTGARAQPGPGAVYRSSPLEAQTFAESDWAALQRELDYSGEPGAGQPPSPPPARDSITHPPPPRPEPVVNEGSPWLQALLFIVLAGVAGWLLFRLLAQGAPAAREIRPPGEGGVPAIALENIEAQLERTDLDPYIERAEAEGAYHLAVRLHFLALLKHLDQAGWVTWKKDHTNRTYLRQMAGQPLYPRFRAATLAFERIWYGNQPPAPADYANLRQQFLELRRQIPEPAAAGRL